MMQKLNDRLRREDEGFTLIELMVVVLIIAILIAIAIPTFLGARGRAQDRAAQSGLRNAVTGAKAIFTDAEDYQDATVSALSSAEPSLTFVDETTASTDPPNEVSVDPNPDNVAADVKSSVFVAAAKSANGDRCWYIMDRVNPLSDPGTWWALEETDPPTCTADSPPSMLTANYHDGVGDAAAGEWVREPGDAVA